jgi:hypothetical protein
MSKTMPCLSLFLLLLVSGVTWAIINPRFTPVHLVNEADVIVAGPLEATDNPMQWKLSAANQLKGKSPASSLVSLANCEKDHVEQIQQTFKDHRGPALLFFGSKDGEKRAYLHVLGQWLKVQPGKKEGWDVLGPSPDMVGTYAGGTDMLVRMSQYILRDSDADVPVTVGVRWAGQAKVGKAPATIAGMAAVDFGKVGKVHLFVGSPDGDQLYQPKGEDGFEDVTAAAGIETKSRRFAWVDVDGDGLAELITWDGDKLSVRTAGKDGKFHAAGAGLTLALDDCLGLAPCSTDGRPGILASTSRTPLLLTIDGTAAWKKTDLPAAAEDLGQPSACVVADLDNDGYPDVLQPGERSGALWKGKAGGFEKPVRVPVASGGGPAVAVVADFHQTGMLDVFLAGQDRNTLWQNEGKCKFTEVFRYGGSISYKCPAGANDAQAVDLNHDGRLDLCLVYDQADLLYHFNRGFRSFGEEGELRLPGTQTAPGQPRLGQKALVAADFNGDGSVDLAVALTNGDLVCYFNDKLAVPGVRLRLPQGTAGPVTASCWIGDECAICAGSLPVAGHSPATYLSTRVPGACKIRYRLPGGAEQVRSVTVEDGAREVVLGAVPSK